ncbi:hypothetical protein F5B20DRAFT_548238 [Whalleya microplaca]|nr:hypothetical protein F5B20DRAFT_548238 [Whalleya microplaca]
MAAPTPTPAPAGSVLCNRCKEQSAITDLRNEQVCKTCFAQFVFSKTVKRLEVLQRSTRGGGPRPPPTSTARPPRYLVAISGGPSSTALLHILSENLRLHLARGQRPRFELVAVHVDTASSSLPPSPSSPTPPSRLLTNFRTRFPSTPIHSLPLSTSLSSPHISWASLPPLNAALPPAQRLADMLSRLPSATSRADVTRLLVRHVLLLAAAARACDVLMLGYNTTALAELTLAETAKGRGFALPWLVNDGALPVPGDLFTLGLDLGGAGGSSDGGAQTTAATGVGESPLSSLGNGNPSPSSIPVYSPLRELFRKELLTYIANTEPPLTDLVTSLAENATDGSTVVSHKDLSIDDVMARYFADVEVHYPSVVANVVRTTGKLTRPEGGGGGDGDGDDWCGICGIALDELGDERWRGEIGEEIGEVEEDARSKRKLCYGCDRSTRA